jgi:hypothetical protein
MLARATPEVKPKVAISQRSMLSRTDVRPGVHGGIDNSEERMGHTMPRLSVLMPVRNSESSIALAVRSTLQALPRDAELLVHDDASSDGTPEVLDRISDRRLRILRSTQVRGVTGGLNYLLNAVDAQVVARMDADDICLPWRFSRQEKALRSADLVFCTSIYFGPSKTKIRPMSPVSISPAAFPLHLLLANPVAHSTMFGWLDRLRAVGGYRDLPLEDYDLWLRLAVNGARMVRLGVPGVMYRVHPSQITASAEWRAQASTDQQIVSAYTELAALHLDRRPDWYAELSAARRRKPLPDSLSALERLKDALDRASATLPLRERWFLMAKCARIIRRCATSSRQ